MDGAPTDAEMDTPTTRTALSTFDGFNENSVGPWFVDGEPDGPALVLMG